MAARLVQAKDLKPPSHIKVFVDYLAYHDAYVITVKNKKTSKIVKVTIAAELAHDMSLARVWREQLWHDVGWEE